MGRGRAPAATVPAAWRRLGNGAPDRLDIQLQPPRNPLLLRHALHQMRVADLGPLGHPVTSASSWLRRRDTVSRHLDRRQETARRGFLGGALHRGSFFCWPLPQAAEIERPDGQMTRLFQGYRPFHETLRALEVMRQVARELGIARRCNNEGTR